MFRHRVRPPTPPLDEVTAERLLGGTSTDDLPVAFRPLGLLLAAASAPPTEGELEGSTAAAAAFVAAHEAARPRTRRRMSLAGATLAGLAVAISTGTAFAATQGALPDPVQQVAHETLAVVGISVPDVTDKTGDDTRGDDTATQSAPKVSTVGGATTGVGAVTPTPASPAVPAAGDPAGTAGADVASEPGAAPGGDGGPGEGDAGPGNPQGGDGGNGNGGGSGNGNGGGSGGGSGSGATEEPTSNLPPQSNGKGHGPPSVPPGLAKKQP